MLWTPFSLCLSRQVNQDIYMAFQEAELLEIPSFAFTVKHLVSQVVKCEWGIFDPALVKLTRVYSVSMPFEGSMPPCIDHMELLAWMQRADFSEHIQRFKLHGNPLNSPHFDAPNTKFAPTDYRRAPIISHHYKQQLSAKASIIPKARPIRFR